MGADRMGIMRCREGVCRELSTEIRTQIENRLGGDGGAGSDQAQGEDAERQRVLEGGGAGGSQPGVRQEHGIQAA